MIVPDVNLLVYADDVGGPHHDVAAAWWIDCLNGTETVGLSSLSVFGFVRLSTTPSLFREPFSLQDAADHVLSWLEQPVVRWLDPPTQHVQDVFALLEQMGVAGSLVTDAQLAALALAYDATVHSNDADFQRFPNLRWYNPLTQQRA